MTNVERPNSCSVASRASRSLLVAQAERDQRAVVVLEIGALRAAALLEVGLVGRQRQRWTRARGSPDRRP